MVKYCKHIDFQQFSSYIRENHLIMNPEDYEKRPYHLRGWLWTARILGSLLAAFLLYIGVQEFLEEIWNDSPSPLVTMINGQYFLFFCLVFAFIGLVLAWWKEGLGGAIAFISIVVLFIGWRDFHVNFILGMMFFALPAVLYMVYGWLVFRFHREQKTIE